MNDIIYYERGIKTCLVKENNQGMVAEVSCYSF